MSKRSYKPVAAAIGSAFVATLGLSLPASADSGLFVAQQLPSGYLLAAEDAEGKCGEGKCGEEKAEGEGKCGEGKCGEGTSGEGKSEGEGKCGEGKCGGAA